MFRKILIANRGEIAVRVARTARTLGIETVAVYSDADSDAPHVHACDEAVHIGPPAAAESYLRAEHIIDAALQTGAQAIHPGYGFLSENATFARALDNAGITFIGPTAETIDAMGSKAAAKDLMERAGVPTTPGYQGEDQSLAVFEQEAERIGYPVLLKATAGGGGKGMRMVADNNDLAEAVSSAQREGQSSFGDPRLLIEKYLPRARHLEVQIFGDGKGEVVHLFERDCSVQRRHQKVIEEAPAPNLPTSVRQTLLEAGVNAGKAVNYRGAGTVEFLYDGAEAVYFMEMNTRLQVEHPVTEMITGLDLVEWQLRIAAGEPLPRRQDEITEHGHAFEARLYAEDADKGFIPSIGTLTTLRLPNDLARIDSGVRESQAITPFYDPMIAKVITAGSTRQEALARMAQALRATRIAGLETNARFLHALCVDTEFVAGNVSTRYIDDHSDSLFARPALNNSVLAAAVLARYAANSDQRQHSTDPWAALTGFRLNKPAKTVAWLNHGDAPSIVRVEQSEQSSFDVEIDPGASAKGRRDGVDVDAPIRFSFSGKKEGNDLLIDIDGIRKTASVVNHGHGRRVFIGADTWDLIEPNPLAGDSASHTSEGSLAAPMPGVVTILSVEPGASVEAGATLLVMEAMKMEHAIKAPHDGVVKGFRFSAGDQVKDGDLLVDFEEAS